MAKDEFAEIKHYLAAGSHYNKASKAGFASSYGKKLTAQGDKSMSAGKLAGKRKGKKSGQDDSVFGAAPSGAPAISDPNPPDADSPFEDSPDPGSERRSPMADAYSPDDTVQLGSEWQRRRLEAQSRVPEWEAEFNSQKRGQ
jgi:hypothetical protein